MSVEERELKSTVALLSTRLSAHGLKISYGEALSLVRAVHAAVSKLPCPLIAAWVLRRVVGECFGDVAAVAAAAGALMYSCGRADYDTVVQCAERGCGGVDMQTASAVMETAYEVGTVLGLPSAEALRIAGLLKYRYLNFKAMLLEDDLRGEGALWGELVAYALRFLH